MATDVQRLERSWAEPSGVVAWLGTVDHKRIGVRYIVTAGVFFVVGPRRPRRPPPPLAPPHGLSRSASTSDDTAQANAIPVV